MARIGSVAAAAFRGDQFASLYLGATRVPTVPGPPRVNTAYDAYIDATEPQNDGGSVITEWQAYVDGGSFPMDEPTFAGDGSWDITLGDLLMVGQVVQLSAINAVGEGPRSSPFTVAPSP